MGCVKIGMAALLCLILFATAAPAAKDPESVDARSQEWLELHIKQDQNRYRELRKQIFVLDNQLAGNSLPAGASREEVSKKRDELLHQATELKARIDYYNETLSEKDAAYGAVR